MKVKLLWSFVLLLLGFYSTAQYCATGGPTSTSDSNVQQVDMTGDAATSISQTGCSPVVTGVQDLTAQSISVTAGTNYTLDVTFGTCGGDYSGVGEVWIDFNHDETFQLAESIGTSSGTPGSTPWDAPVSFIVNVPITAINGDTRMRVMQRESGSLPLDPCASYRWGSVMDFTVNISGATAPPTCSQPTALGISNVTDTSVDLSWTNANASNASSIEYGPSSGFILGAGTTTIGMGNTATISGLNPTTEYVFYISQDCSAQGDGISTQAGPIAATTLASIPVNDACADAITINDGDSLAGNTTASTNIENLTPCSGGDVGLACDAVGDATPNDGPIDFSAGVWYVYSSGGQESISIEAGGFDTELQVFSGACGSLACVAADDDSSNNGSGSFVCFDATTATDYYIYLDGHNGATGTFNIDLNVTPFPDCFVPTDLTATNLSANSVELGWTEYGTATSWNIELVDVTGGGTVTGTATTTGVTNPYNQIGLTSNNDYEFYVQADCGAIDGVSEWAGPIAFTTACDVYNVPFTEGFETTSTGSSTSNNAPDCWSSIDSGSGSAYVYDNSTVNVQSGGSSFRLFNSFNTTGDYLLISPQIAELTIDGIQVEFSVKGASGQELEVGTIADPSDASTFNLVETITLTSSSFEDVEVFIPAGINSYVAIKHGQTGSSDNYYLDDFSFTETPSCIVPTALSVSNILSTSADLGWTAGASETLWNVELVDITALGTVTGTATSTGVTNPYNQAGLSPNNDYQFYVQADCGVNGTSAWVGPFSFSTTALPTLVPYNQDFELNNFGTSMSTTTSVESSIDINTVASNSSTLGARLTGGGSAGFSGGSTSATETQAWINNITHISSLNISVDATAETVVLLTFDLKQTYSYGPNYSWFRVVVDGNQVGPSYNPTTQNSDPFTTISVNLSAYAGTSFNLSLQSSNKYDDANGDSGNGDNAYIDNVSITAPACLTPTGLTATGIDGFSANLGWTVGSSETSWNIELVDITGGGTVTGIATTNGVTNPFNQTGLTPSNDYAYYVQADCGMNGTSDWAGPFTFSTTVACPAPSTLSVSNISSSSADLSWTAGASEILWNVELVDVTAGGTVTGVATATGVTNPYNITGLANGNDYQFYVQADCGGMSGVSAWSGPISFSTQVDFCAGDAFSDPGGALGNYGDDENETYTICPNNPGDKVVINFSEFSFENRGADRCWDGLTIYDGDVATGTIIPPATGTENLWCWDRSDSPAAGTGDLLGVSIATTSASGCITIVLTSDGSTQRAGFTATASCESSVYMWDGAAWSNAPEGNITVNDNLYVNEGSVASLTTNISTKNVYVSPNASLEVDNGDIVVAGNLINNGSITGSDQVVMNSTSGSISGVGSMTNLTIGSTGFISIDGPQAITQQLDVLSGGQLDAAGNITMVSNATGTARIDEFDVGSIIGDVNIERYIPAGNRSFRFVGTSVTGSSVFDSWQEGGFNNSGFGTHITGTVGTVGTVNATTGHDETATGNQSMFKWSNSSQDWVGITDTRNEVLNAGEFYRLFIRGDRGASLTTSSPTTTATTLRSSGSLYQTPFSVSPATSDGQFFALANPYQSKVSLDASTTGTTSDMYYWDTTLAPNGQYSTIQINGAPTAGTSGNATNILEPGQAVFFIDSSVAMDPAPSVAFSQSNKVTGNNNVGIFNVNTLQQRLRLKIYHASRYNNNLSESDGLYIDFNTNHSLNVDSNDAVKLNGGNVNMSVSKTTGQLLSVERRTLPTASEAIQLNMSNYLTANYTMVATVDVLPGLTAYLKDNYDTSLTELIQGTSTSINFSVDVNDALSIDASRFEIVFELVTLSNENTFFGDQISLYPNPVEGDVLNISLGSAVEENVTVTLFNALGQQVISKKFDAISRGIISLDNLSGLESGLYIVHLNNGVQTITKKVVLD